MWAPRTWADITALLGSAEETSSLDFKRQLSKNEDIAKDLGAMSVNGGVVVYGIDEDKTTRQAVAIHKLPLAGVEERLQQVVGSRIAPPCEVDVVTVTERPGDADGVVVVIVPPSTMAPHMVGGRYPCRHGTVNDSLEEAEVARLYARRHELTRAAPSTDDLLASFTAPRAVDDGDASAAFGGVGRLRLAVAPVASGVAHPAAPWLEEALQRAYHDTASTLVPRLTWTPKPSELDSLGRWEPRGSIGWTSGRSGGAAERVLRARSSAGTLAYPTRLSFQATWPLEVVSEDGTNRYRCAYEPDVALATIIFVAFAGQFLEQLEGVGPVQCVAQYAGFEGAVSFRATKARAEVAATGLKTAHDLTESTLASVPELRDSPDETAKRLVDRWLVAFYEFDSLWPHLLDAPAGPAT